MSRKLCFTLLAPLVALAACATQQHQAPASTTKAPAPAAEPVYSEPTPTVVNYRPTRWTRTDIPAGWNWNGAALPTGDLGTSLITLEKMVQDPVSVGQDFDYQLRVTNVGGGGIVLDDVTVTDGQLDGSWKFVSADPAGKSAGGKMTWNVGRLADGESRTIKVRGTATGEGTMFGCASVDYTPIVCIDTHALKAAITLTKTLPAKVSQCDPIPMRLVVTNTGTGPANNVKVSDTLPAGWTATDGRSTLTWDVGSLRPNESRELTATLSSSKTGAFTNTAKATADGGLEAESTAMTSVHKPVLTIAKSGRTEQFINKTVTYTITVKNTGDWPAANAMVEDTITGADAITAVSDGGTVSGSNVSWRLGSIAAGAERTVTVTVRRDSEGTTTDKATAMADCADAVAADAKTVWSGIPAVLLEVIDTNDPVEVGGETTYQIKVTNQGSAPDRQISIVCDIEAEGKPMSTGGPTNGRIEGQRVTFEPLASLAAGGVVTWTIKVRALKAGDTRFTVVMKTEETGREVKETEATRFYE